MIFLLIFAFLGGVVTILSPCILPLLPIILSSSSGGKSRPLGVVTGFIGSFTFFTLFLTAIVKLTGIPSDSLRVVSILIIGIFGLSYLIPQFQLWIEQVFVRFARIAPKHGNEPGFKNGLLIGFSLGLLWTPCVGPILAGVISLALSGSVTTDAIFITLAYSLGTAIPMFIIMRAGGTALKKVPWLVRNIGKVQKAFGVLMILTAFAIFFNFDRRLQTFVLEKFPQYGVGVTSLEDNELVDDALKGLRSEEQEELKQAPEIISGGAWINSDPLIITNLKNKVVLVDFWTYSCINCIRTLPHLRDWWEKYQTHGLVIIGVHTPEFEFEKSLSNLQTAVKDFELKYPIVQDNDYATWKAFDNRFWPAKYLIDKDGKIRYTHFGEGNYDETEKMIQTLLTEMGASISDEIEASSKLDNSPRSPETYLGYSRLDALVSEEKIVMDEFTSYSTPEVVPFDFFALDGTWKVEREFSTPQAGGNLIMAFEGKQVFLIMRSDSPTRVRINLDSEPVATTNQGEDVKNSLITVNKDRLYKLIKLPETGFHILWLEFLDPGTEVFAFTFG